jgi:acetyltransferase-like isoleucine patch superfamily enzyme
MTGDASWPPGRWLDGVAPKNVRLGPNTLISGGHVFKRYCSRREPGLVIGAHCTMDGVHFALGQEAQVTIGDYCYFSNALLLCELELHIGRCVLMGWNATIADSDFHPIAPAQRILDAIACSPLGKGNTRPPLVCKPVVIGDDVWIGPNATVLKGVRIGAGAFVEPGALVTRDVPPRTRVAGNPAQAVGTL